MARISPQLKSYIPISDMDEPAEYVTELCDREEITNGVRNITISDNTTHGTLNPTHAGHVGSCDGDNKSNYIDPCDHRSDRQHSFDFAADIDLGLGEADHEGDEAFLAQGDMYLHAYNESLNNSDLVDGDGDKFMAEVDCIYLCPVLNNGGSIDNTNIAGFEPVRSYKTNYGSNMQSYVDSMELGDGLTSDYGSFKLAEFGDSDEQAGEGSEESEEELAEFMHLGI